jgi:transglutaminase-like putative cysteine protease
MILVNSFVLLEELPLSIMLITWSAALLSLFIKKDIVRTAIKITLLFASLFFLRYQFKTLLVTDAGVSFVLILASLKLWELDKESDHFNMFLILALLESCLFLLKPTFLTFSLGLIKIVLFFYFILKIRNYDLTLLNGKRLLVLVIPSVLLSLLLFYTFPRFTSGFINSSNPQLLFSGVDSQINFKSLGALNLSSKVVFRVFGLNASKNPIPILYWRENILWDYYKEEWKTGYLNMKAEQLPVKTPVTFYKVQLEKDYNEFLPVLDGVSNIVRSNLDYNYFSEGSFRLKNISKTIAQYDVNSNYHVNLTTLTPIMQRKGVRLISNKKDEIAALIKRGKTLSTDDEKFRAIESFFKQKKFEYTLNPPLYNSLEDFILYGKSGYCSHFASAFTYLARTVGLPARIISGYQGGEYNPFDQTVLVREMDAHAWVEIYFESRGWVRYDPTAFVAPGRVQLGSRNFHDSLVPYLNLFNYKMPRSLFRFKFIEQSSLWLDYINSTFSNNILNFDKERQQQLLRSFLPKTLGLGAAFSIAFAVALPLFWLFFKWLSKERISPAERRYKKFTKRMSLQGVRKNEYETATVFSTRCKTSLPELSPYIQRETEAYIDSFYKS